MKIVMTDTKTNIRKLVKFGELINRLQDEKINVVNRRWINFKLLNGETIKVDGCEFKKEVG